MAVLSRPRPPPCVVLYTCIRTASLCAALLAPLLFASSLLHKSFVSVQSSLDQSRPERTRLPPSPSHGDGAGRERGGLVADAVQPDLCGGLLRLHCGRGDRGRRALHPRVVDDVLEGRAVGWPQRQTPLDQLLAFWRRKENNKSGALNWV